MELRKNGSIRHLPSLGFDVEMVFTAITHKAAEAVRVETLAIGKNQEIALVTEMVLTSRTSDAGKGESPPLIQRLDLGDAQDWLKVNAPFALQNFKRQLTKPAVKHIQIKVDNDLFLRTQEIASRLGISRNELVKRILLAGLENQ